MRETLSRLYDGGGGDARAFRVALLVFDVATICYFLWTATETIDATILALDVAIGLVIAADVAARAVVAENRWRYFVRFTTLADLAIIVSVAAPLAFGGNLGFLRVLRVLRLVRTFRLMERVDRMLAAASLNTRVSSAALNLLAFVLIVTSLVWVVEHQRNDQVNTIVDALYFTVTSLTTTGYGDIILEGRVGRLMAIAIMLLGIGFFLQLLQAIWRPDKAEVTCGTCGLSVHDRDAVHCKHCGEAIFIETEGET